jgi:hypothetical protein
MATSEERLSLDALGVLCGTDRSVLGHGYLRHYDRAFSAMRDLPINIIEIGVATGASVQMWKRYFTCAQIIGIDILEPCKRFETDRITIEIGSQADGDFLRRVADRFPPTIVIDDGSHQADHILVSLEHLWPKVLPGGCYVIEDLFFHSGSDAKVKRGSAAFAPQDLIRDLVHQRLGVEFVPERLADIGRKVYPHTDWIETVTGAALIWKQQRRLPYFDELEQVVEQCGTPSNWCNFGCYIMREHGPVERAMAAANRAIAMDPGQPLYHNLLSQVCERGGDLQAAINAQAEAVRLSSSPFKASAMERLNALHAASANAAGTANRQ